MSGTLPSAPFGWEISAALDKAEAAHLDGVQKDYTLEIQGRPITITKEQFDDGMWQEIVRLGSIAVSHRRGKFKSDSAQEQCARSCGR